MQVAEALVVARGLRVAGTLQVARAQHSILAPLLQVRRQILASHEIPHEPELLTDHLLEVAGRGQDLDDGRGEDGNQADPGQQPDQSGADLLVRLAVRALTDDYQQAAVEGAEVAGREWPILEVAQLAP